MNYCQYCQEQLSDERTFIITAPNKKLSYLCIDCMNDILEFFKSGKPEKELMSTLNSWQPNNSSLTIYQD
jgi:hypothetical protein